jgi:hypothetical protein
VTCSIGVTDVKTATLKTAVENGNIEEAIDRIFDTSYKRSISLLHKAKGRGRNRVSSDGEGRAPAISL